MGLGAVCHSLNPRSEHIAHHYAKASWQSHQYAAVCHVA